MSAESALGRTLKQAGKTVEELRELLSRGVVVTRDRTQCSSPGCFTQGATRDEALERAEEAIAGHVEALEARGYPVPVDDVLPELCTVEV